MSTPNEDPQGAQDIEEIEQRLVDLVGHGEASARVERLNLPPDTDTEDKFAFDATLRFDLTTEAEVRALNRAIPNAVALYARGKNSASNEKFKASREADDQLKITLWGVTLGVHLKVAKFRTSKVETVLTCTLQGGGLTWEQVTTLKQAQRAGGLAAFEWKHAQGDLFAAVPTDFEPKLEVDADGELPPEAGQ